MDSGRARCFEGRDSERQAVPPDTLASVLPAGTDSLRARPDAPRNRPVQAAPPPAGGAAADGRGRAASGRRAAGGKPAGGGGDVPDGRGAGGGGGGGGGAEPDLPEEEMERLAALRRQMQAIMAALG